MEMVYVVWEKEMKMVYGSMEIVHIDLLCVFYYHMGTNFQGGLNFAVFEGTSKFAKKLPSQKFITVMPTYVNCTCRFNA